MTDSMIMLRPILIYLYIFYSLRQTEGIAGLNKVLFPIAHMRFLIPVIILIQTVVIYFHVLCRGITL